MQLPAPKNAWAGRALSGLCGPKAKPGAPQNPKSEPVSPGDLAAKKLPTSSSKSSLLPLVEDLTPTPEDRYVGGAATYPAFCARTGRRKGDLVPSGSNVP
jgi:hypothetical protein